MSPLYRVSISPVSPSPHRSAAILAAKAETAKPSIIKIRTVIGFGSTKAGTGEDRHILFPVCASCGSVCLPPPPFHTLIIVAPSSLFTVTLSQPLSEVHGAPSEPRHPHPQMLIVILSLTFTPYSSHPSILSLT